MSQLICPTYNNLFFELKMGNGEFEVPQHVSNQWAEVYKSNKKYLKNRITHEEFEFMVLEKLQESQDISQLIERSIYSIPKTPKIIILNDQNGQLFILVQQYDLFLPQHLPKILFVIDVLELLSQALSVFHCLLKKYGPFGINERMIGLNKSCELFGWINENKQKNQVQIPIQINQNSQRIMVSQIINIFKKYSHVFSSQEDLHRYRTFESLQNQLTKTIRKRKMELIGNSTQVKNPGEGFRRALSPQTSFGSMRHIEIKSPKAAEGQSKVYKRNVPNFLKRVNDKNISFLDSLNHKRTVTIDQNQKDISSKERFISHIRGLNREKCSSKSLNKVKSLKVTPSKDRNTNFSGEMSKLSFPTSNYTEKTYDLLTQSGSSSNYIIKKRQFLEANTAQTAKVTQTWKFQSFPPKPTKDKSQKFYNYHHNKSNYWQVNGESCLFHGPQSSKTQAHPIPLGVNNKVPLMAMCSNTTQSNYFNELSPEKAPIIEEQSQKVSKTLEEEFNDFFSNTSKGPRFPAEALSETNGFREQFSKVIDF